MRSVTGIQDIILDVAYFTDILLETILETILERRIGKTEDGGRDDQNLQCQNPGVLGICAIHTRVYRSGWNISGATAVAIAPVCLVTGS